MGLFDDVIHTRRDRRRKESDRARYWELCRLERAHLNPVVQDVLTQFGEAYWGLEGKPSFVKACEGSAWIVGEGPEPSNSYEAYRVRVIAAPHESVYPGYGQLHFYFTVECGDVWLACRDTSQDELVSALREAALHAPVRLRGDGQSLDEIQAG